MRELKLYIVHGLLHLHGFDDQTPTEARRMKIGAGENSALSIVMLSEALQRNAND